MAKKWIVKNTANEDFCGVDAGSVQFAHGEAEVSDARMAAWFREHDGYKVSEAKEPANKPASGAGEGEGAKN